MPQSADSMIAAQKTLTSVCWAILLAFPLYPVMSKAQLLTGYSCETFPVESLSDLAGLIPDQTLSVPMPGAERQWHANDAFRPLPLCFERNDGQSDPEVRFLAHAAGLTAFIEPTETIFCIETGASCESDGINLTVDRVGPCPVDGRERFRNTFEGDRVDCLPHLALLRMKFLGATSTPSIDGVNELRGKVNYFLGNEPSRWHTNISTFAEVLVREVYPGIDVLYHGHDGQLEYDFIVAPGADPSLIHLSFEGPEQPELADNGDLVFRIGDQQVRCGRPKVFQELKGVTREIDADYVLNKDAQTALWSVSLSLAAYDHSRRLTIDPVLVYSRTIGSDKVASPRNCIQHDSQGDLYVAGSSRTHLSPSSIVPAQGPGGGSDIFVMKRSSDGNLIFVTYLGGSGDEGSGILAVDVEGSTFVAAGTHPSLDYPIVGAYQSKPGRCVLTKLAPDGASLKYSTYFGGECLPYCIAVDSAGSAWMTGWTGRDLPTTTNAFQATYAGYVDNPHVTMGDAFLAKFTPDGKGLLYSTYLGGQSLDLPIGLAIDGQDNALLAGETNSSDFPTVNALQPVGPAGALNSGWFAKFTANGMPVFSSYFGGSVFDALYAVVPASNGEFFLVGVGRSPDFPIVNALQTDNHGDNDITVARVRADGQSLVFSSFLGGSRPDYAGSATTDSAGNLVLAGVTRSLDVPLIGAIASPSGADDSAYLAALSPDGATLRFATSFPPGPGVSNTARGGNYVDGVTVDAGQNIYVVTTVNFADSGFGDVYLLKLSPSFSPVIRVIRSGNTLLISWQSSAGSMQLETSDSVGLLSTWTAESEAQASVGDQTVVTLPVTSSARFYRLRQL